MPGAGPGRLRHGAARCAPPTAATWLPGVSDGAYWQLITSAFTHVQLLHIAFNMFALYLFGPQLELFFGRVRYLALYFISALTGSAARLLGRPRVHARPSAPRARSSG